MALLIFVIGFASKEIMLKKNLFKKKLKIGAHTYKLVVKPDWSQGKELGLTLRDKGEIWINSDIIESEQIVAFFHEYLHCVNGELEEKEVDYLAQALAQFFIDNF
jgi:hypothetical protein